MPKKVNIKTTKNSLNVNDYLNAIEPADRRKDAKQLAKLFKQVCGVKPRMWGTSIVGFGEYTYYRANGDEGDFMATGFSMRQSGPVLYIMPGHQSAQDLLAELGPHKLGKSCLYLKSLDGVNLDVIEQLIKRGIEELKETHSVRM